jgi:hypothetical protein
MVAGQSREVATGPVGSTDWRLAEPAFVGAVTELVRARDKVAIRMLFLDLERGLSSLPGLGEDQAVLLDRVTSLVCRLLLIGHARLAERLVDLLFMSFLGANLRAERSQADVATLVEIATRVMCVGALAVRRRNWAFVRSLTLRRDESGGMCYNNWLRQTVTSASRAGVFTRKGELVGLSHEYSMTHPGVAPDVPDDRDALLNSLCQYDLLWNLVAIAASTSSAKDSGDWYPSFGRYHSERSEPALLAVIGDQKMREQLGLGSDARLAGDLAELIETTAKEFFTGAWHGFMDRRVKAFIEAHHVPGQEAV